MLTSDSVDQGRDALAARSDDVPLDELSVPLLVVLPLDELVPLLEVPVVSPVDDEADDVAPEALPADVGGRLSVEPGSRRLHADSAAAVNTAMAMSLKEGEWVSMAGFPCSK